MNAYVDVDLQSLIQSPGNRSAASAWEFKSQDTLETNLFFCSQGVVLDLGESPVMSYGLVAKSNVTTFLVFENVFVRKVDPVNGVFYQCLAVFNTTEMRDALATLSPLSCILEIRFQLADGEIVHTLDQAVTIDRTILVEGGTPAATVIAVYPDPSVLEVKSNKDQHSGYAALDANGFLTPTDFDPTVVELVASRDVASGHAGLDIDTLLLAAELPVDGVTTQVVAGKLVAVGPAQGVLAVTTEPFIVPAVSATVPISTPTGSLTALNFYTISGAGSYQLSSITDDTHAVFLNVGSSLNAAAGTVIALDATISWSGPPGTIGPIGLTGATGAPGSGGGDMLKSVYDTATRGYVDRAVLSDTVTSISGLSVTRSQISDLSGLAITKSQISDLSSLLSDAETTTGQTLINAAAGVLKRLVAGLGLNFDILTTPGAIIINSNWSDAETSAGASLIASAGVLKRIIAGANIALDVTTTPGGIIISSTGGSTALTDAETTTGQTLISNTSGIIKRLVGGSNITLDASTTPGAIILNGTIGGSGVAALSDAETTTGSTLIAATSGVIKRLVAGTGMTLDTTTTTGAVILNGPAGGSLYSGLTDQRGYVTTCATFTIPALGSTVVITVPFTGDLFIGMRVVVTDGVHSLYGNITAVVASTSITVNNAGVGNVSGTMAAGRVYMASGITAYSGLSGLPTLGTAAAYAAPAASTNATTTQLVRGDDTRLVAQNPQAVSLLIDTPTVKLYGFILSAPYTQGLGGYTLYARLKSGTATVSLNKNGISLISALSVTTTLNSGAAASGFTAGDLFEINVTAVSSPVDLIVTLVMNP